MTRGMRGMLLGITSGMRGMILLMTGLLFRAFMGVSGLISAIMSPTIEDSYMGKQEVTLHNVLHYDDKTLCRGA
jgi:hypothetical protein